MRRHGGTLCATLERWRRSMPTKTSKSKASEGKPNALQKPLQPSEELAAVVGTSPLPLGGEQNLGVHPLAQPAEPGEPPRDPGGRQAHESLRHGQGDHVRDEQAPHPTSEVREPGWTSLYGEGEPHRIWLTISSGRSACMARELSSLSNSVSSRSVFAGRCSRETATLEGWITCASTPRASSQRASQSRRGRLRRQAQSA
jgi:hypothetical protein